MPRNIPGTKAASRDVLDFFFRALRGAVWALCGVLRNSTKRSEDCFAQSRGSRATRERLAAVSCSGTHSDRAVTSQRSRSGGSAVSSRASAAAVVRSTTKPMGNLAAQLSLISQTCSAGPFGIRRYCGFCGHDGCFGQPPARSGKLHEPSNFFIAEGEACLKVRTKPLPSPKIEKLKCLGFSFSSFGLN